MPAPDPSPSHTPEPDPLGRERAHLTASRAALRAMREDAEALDIRDVTANWVNAAVLGAQIDERIKSLADLSHTPLFFGRLDYLHAVGADRAEGAEGECPLPEAADMTVHIGRRHVHDADGDPMVIDWRAPVSQPFYRASKKDPLDVGLRRRFGYTAGELTAYEDEHLSDPVEREEGAHTSKLLQAEIERPRVGPMRDIVATIQPEQDEIVRSGLSGSVCVQGGPGTGKTAVGLHRVAYLLYAHRDRLARTGTLVIGPNKSFLHYIEQVLPALGELEVKQATVDDLVAMHGEVRGTDETDTAVIKGDARMAEVLRRALRSHVTAVPSEPVVVVRGSRRWRVPAYEVEEIVRELLARDIRYGAAHDALPQRIAHAVLVRMEEAGEAPDDRVQDAVARNPAVKAAVKAAWPAVDPAKLVLRLLSDADFLAEHAEGLLSEDEQKRILWAKPVPRSVRSVKWSAADVVLLDEAAVSSVRESPGSLSVRRLDSAADAADSAAAVVAACAEALRHEGSTGLIAADARVPELAAALGAAGYAYLSPGEETTAEARLTLVPASLAKGLEYDYVVLDEPAAVVDGEPDERTGLRRLYVALTRAVSGLTIVHAAPLPGALATLGG